MIINTHYGRVDCYRQIEGKSEIFPSNPCDRVSFLDGRSSGEIFWADRSIINGSTTEAERMYISAGPDGNKEHLYTKDEVLHIQAFLHQSWSSGEYNLNIIATENALFWVQLFASITHSNCLLLKDGRYPKLGGSKDYMHYEQCSFQTFLATTYTQVLWILKNCIH